MPPPVRFSVNEVIYCLKRKNNSNAMNPQFINDLSTPKHFSDEGRETIDREKHELEKSGELYQLSEPLGNRDCTVLQQPFSQDPTPFGKILTFFDCAG